MKALVTAQKDKLDFHLMIQYSLHTSTPIHLKPIAPPAKRGPVTEHRTSLSNVIERADVPSYSVSSR